ncbi:hypothetical protein [Mycolicibacterium llatzerense]|uniref:hypothetical protein n=1 Tax=Mycolicibacterium llatzerense TaxID=280871 RepID=UPI0021B4FF68|nr:hypothetical protein [Mycolicibacterium llatzerense]MCT7367080.1 hypothetical protein [Mycolicibacterium llatzerense]
MGIARFTTKVTLTMGVAAPSTGAAVVGRPVWAVEYTVEERGKPSSFRVPDYAENGARKPVANLKPGLRVEDVYSEPLG